jgi:hypothetical protein
MDKLTDRAPGSNEGYVYFALLDTPLHLVQNDLLHRLLNALSDIGGRIDNFSLVVNDAF